MKKNLNLFGVPMIEALKNCSLTMDSEKIFFWDQVMQNHPYLNIYKTRDCSADCIMYAVRLAEENKTDYNINDAIDYYIENYDNFRID